MIDSTFWNEKKVFVTGHTGFKGSWLSMWLSFMGARVIGYALDAPTNPSLYYTAHVPNMLEHVYIEDIRNKEKLTASIIESNPDIVIHMAAQPLVRESYVNPTETFATNVMGTVHVLEAVRKASNVRVVINVTTDKCYENKEWIWGYRENEPLGGYDPYSSSKACSELVTSSYRSSFFNKDSNKYGIAVASARAGNVIGGGDWATDRLIPDCLRALTTGTTVRIRNPNSIRPWQHVLEPLSGYITLAQKMWENISDYSEAWNFGPHYEDARSVKWIVEELCHLWGQDANYSIDDGEHPHEAAYLKLDISKANHLLDWYPTWNLRTALEKIVEWGKAYQVGHNMQELCREQIKVFSSHKVRKIT